MYTLDPTDNYSPPPLNAHAQTMHPSLYNLRVLGPLHSLWTCLHVPFQFQCSVILGQGMTIKLILQKILLCEMSVPIDKYQTHCESII